MEEEDGGEVVGGEMDDESYLPLPPAPDPPPPHYWPGYWSSTTTMPSPYHFTTTTTTTPYYYHWTTVTTSSTTLPPYPPRPEGYPYYLPWPPADYMHSTTTTTVSPYPPRPVGYPHGLPWPPTASSTETPFPYGTFPGPDHHPHHPDPYFPNHYEQYLTSLAAAGYPLPPPHPTTAPLPPVQVCDLSAWPDCQCIKQYKDMFTEDGRGNCNVGAAKSDLQVWCYVNPDTAVCPDIKPSKNYQ